MASYLRRGVATSLLAGFPAGLFAFVTGEPLLDQAIGLEESNHQEGHAFATHEYEGDGHTAADGGGTLSRSVQKVGLFFATALSGAFVGGLFIALPVAMDPGVFPSGVLWSFQLSSRGTQLVLWTGSGVVFGLLCERANRGELR
jgi:Probable cobalt transporter subunit (CbtA)